MLIQHSIDKHGIEKLYVVCKTSTQNFQLNLTSLLINYYVPLNFQLIEVIFQNCTEINNNSMKSYKYCRHHDRLLKQLLTTGQIHFGYPNNPCATRLFFQLNCFPNRQSHHNYQLSKENYEKNIEKFQLFCDWLHLDYVNEWISLKNQSVKQIIRILNKYRLIDLNLYHKYCQYLQNNLPKHLYWKIFFIFKDVQKSIS